MNNRSSRKQFLIAENELRRVQLIEDFTALRAGLHTISARVNWYKSVASSAALLITGLTAFQRGRLKNTDVKTSWLRTIMKGAGLASTVWLAFQAPGRERRIS